MSFRRRCKARDCTTILSRYNVEPYCSIHEERRPVKGDGVKAMPHQIVDRISRLDRAAYRDGSWLR